MTITTTQLASRITRSRQAQWTLNGHILDSVIAAVRADDQTVFDEVVTAARDGDETAGEVLVWAVLPGLRRMQRRRPSAQLDDLIGLVWLTVADIDLAAIPTRRRFLDRIKRRVERAADCASARHEHARDPFQLDLWHPAWLTTGCDPNGNGPAGGEPAASSARSGNRAAVSWEDSTANRVADRDALTGLAASVTGALADGRIGAATWAALVELRVHGVTYPARDARDASAMTSRVSRATRLLRESCRTDQVA